MMGKKALIVRLASLRREDISNRIMNEEQGIAKEKNSLKGRSLRFDGAILLHHRTLGPKSGNQLLGDNPKFLRQQPAQSVTRFAGHFCNRPLRRLLS